MMRRAGSLLILVVIAVVALFGTVGAATSQTVIEKLVSPGPLANAHARLESNCQSCHVSFDKKAQSQKCIDCHKPIGADLAARTGFHGRSRDVRGVECKTCHTDHAGRAARLVNLNPRTFNHAATDFMLNGAHAKVACANCHTAPKFRSAPSACVDCHRKNDPHKGSLGPACSSCHTEVSWKEARFDHSMTSFPLRGLHARASCASCHGPGTPQRVAATCISCHAKDDAHRGGLGPSCANCHDSNGWKAARFDHDRTGFALTGGHAKPACAACHLKSDFTQAKPACASCHLKDDVHKAKYGEKCAECHTVKDWKVANFDHRRTGFELLGKHISVKCEGCHEPKPARSKDPPKECVGCHTKDDVHRGRYGADCAQCHNNTDWKAPTFDHARTRFPLAGGHAKATCVSCHTEPPSKLKLRLDCNGCHKKDDPHVGQLGPDCASCHSEETWKARIRFDHDLASFPLIGKHAGVACADCHQSKRYKDASSICADCHAKQDPHRGAYSIDCGQCHNPVTWKTWRFDHAKTRFVLDGAHTDTACASCHKPGRSKPGRTCVSCHQVDDPHRGAFSSACEQCHITRSFKVVRSNS